MFSTSLSMAFVAAQMFVAVVLACVLGDLVFVRRRIPLTVLLCVPLGLVAAASFAGTAADVQWTRWSAAVWLALAAWVGAPDDNRHPRRWTEGRQDVLAFAVLVAVAAFSVAVSAPDTGGPPLAGILALGGAGLAATRQRVPEQLEPTLGPGAQVGAVICFLLAVSFAASASPFTGAAVYAVLSALLIAALHLANRWDRATAYPWTDVAGVATLVALVAVAGI